MISDNPISSLASWDRRIAQAANPRQRLILEHVKQRMVGEMLGTVEQVLELLADDFELKLHHSLLGAFQLVDKIMLRGMIEALPRDEHLLSWVDAQQVLVTADEIAIRGILYNQVPGVIAQAQYGESINDTAATYRVSMPVATFGTYSGDHMVYEDSYIDAASATFSKLGQDEITSRASVRRALREAAA